MRACDLVGVTEHRRIRTTLWSEENPPLPDLVNQDFRVGAPNRAWCGDITYIPTDEGWLYLASVLDLGSRRLVGWNMADWMPRPPSRRGSTVTTTCACARVSTTCRQSSGNSITVSFSSKPHNQVSGWRGEPHLQP